MARITPIVEALVAAHATPEMILAAVRAAEDQAVDALEKRREADAVRQARKRSRDITLRHSDRSLTRGGVAPVEDKPITTQIEPKKENKTPRAALEAVLDAERADAVIVHRQRLRKPLTEHAAKLLAGKFAECPDPNAAADTMIGNGWQGFEPEWLVKPQARGSPPAKSRGVGGVFSDLVEHLDDGQEYGERGEQTSGAAVLSLPNRRAG